MGAFITKKTKICTWNENVKKNIFYYAFIVVIVLSISLPYLLGNGLPFFSGDLLSSYLDFAYHPSFSWWSVYFSLPRIIGLSAFYEYLLGAFFSISNNFIFALKMDIVFQMIVAAISMFAFSFSFTKSRFASVLSTFFYILTPFYTAQLNFHIYLAWAYALLPLAYLMIYKIATEINNIKLIYAGLIFALAIFFPGPQFIYITTIGLLIFLFNLSVNRSYIIRPSKKLVQPYVKFIIAFLIALGLSLYFIVPGYLIPSNLPYISIRPFPLTDYRAFSLSLMEASNLLYLESNNVFNYFKTPFPAITCRIICP